MRQYFILLCFLFQQKISQAQLPEALKSKPPIDSAAIADWADLLWSDPVLSSDGNYLMYSIENLPPGNSTLVIQSTQNGWKKQFIGAERGFFTKDCKQAVFKRNDTMFLQKLGEVKIELITNVESYRKPAKDGGQWLACQRRTNNQELMLKNLLSGKEEKFPWVTEYLFDNNGRVLLIKTKKSDSSSKSESIRWINLSGNKRFTIYTSTDNIVAAASRFQFDEAGNQLIFIITKKSNKESENKIAYYKPGLDSSIVLVTNVTTGIDSTMVISNSAPSFSQNGKHIFFKVQQRSIELPKPDANAIKVDLWNYKDNVIQQKQLYNLKTKKTDYELSKIYQYALSIEDRSLLMLRKPNYIGVFIPGPGDVILVGNKEYFGDRSWMTNTARYSLISLKDKWTYGMAPGQYNDFSFSPNGKYLVFYDINLKSYFSLDLEDRHLTNLTNEKNANFINEDNNERTKYNTNTLGIGGWIESDAILIYDNYDVWKVDPSGINQPINITNHYGAINQIKFRLIPEVSLMNRIFSKNKALLLTAFDMKSKYNGFFMADPNNPPNPNRLTLDSFNYYTEGTQTPHGGLINMKPIKAEKANIWLVKRHNATTAANFYITTDFKSFRRITNANPQTSYNWFTTELISWTQPDGIPCQGILYKPEDFDNKKLYPVIIHYYEKRSSRMYHFLQPEWTGGDLNIPWFVSRGYLVFTPDIHYIPGKTGESILNSILSGAQNLKSLAYVDSTKIGIQGHSFGGYETNFLITHTNIFAAAAEGAGSSNLISQYSDSRNNRESTSTDPFEIMGQFRIEETLWENPQTYIENSPIFEAHKITTPLFIMHNYSDNAVPWGQALEFFMALRRNGKKVWMVQYDQCGHGLDDPEARDYTIRLTQFFDHYLKEMPCPVWMSQGIPALHKGLESGYQYDQKGNCGTDCNICSKLNKQEGKKN